MNLCHKDPVKREIFRNRGFRVGLSHAINRPEIIVAAYQRQGEPAQPAPRPESDFYDEMLAKQYTEYDVDLANRHFDKAGYRTRDDNGVARPGRIADQVHHRDRLPGLRLRLGKRDGPGAGLLAQGRPMTMMIESDYPEPGPSNPEQYFTTRT